ncbi:unnamed protein product [Amaranthus hypochondriacus]
MKFLFEYVTCCTTFTNTSASSEEEFSSQSLVDSTPTLSIRRRRKRPARSSSSSSADWKPSLFAISEDNPILVTPQKPPPVIRRKLTPVISPRNVKRSGSSTAQVNAGSRSHEYGRDPLPVAFPAFTAAPFMF